MLIKQCAHLSHRGIAVHAFEYLFRFSSLGAHSPILGAEPHENDWLLYTGRLSDWVKYIEADCALTGTNYRAVY